MSRLGNASELIGFGRRSLALAAEYAQTRKVGENVVTDFQGIQWLIAECYEKLYSAQLSRDRAAAILDRVLTGGRQASPKKTAIDASEYTTNQVLLWSAATGSTLM
jgi:alkylation response protein AidB-like acyl-CoA dehydrogenase